MAVTGMLPSLGGHLIYGSILGVAYACLLRRDVAHDAATAA